MSTITILNITVAGGNIPGPLVHRDRSSLVFIGLQDTKATKTLTEPFRGFGAKKVLIVRAFHFFDASNSLLLTM